MEDDERDNLLVWVDGIMIFFVGMRFFMSGRIMKNISLRGK